MRRLLIVASTTLALTPLSAQFTTPAGHLTKPGDRYAYNYGLSLAGSAYQKVRFQVTDPDMTKTNVLLRMDWRPQTYLTYISYRGQGRTFTNVTLKLGNSNTTFVKDMTKNFAATPTTVFSAKWSQPSILSGKPKQVWGSVGSFPFSKVMVFVATKGMLLQDWTHAGGKLANGSTFSSTYYLDGNYKATSSSSSVYTFPSSAATAASRYLPKYYYNSAGGACNDSGVTSTTSNAYAYFSFYVYAATHPTVSYRGKARISGATINYIAPGKPVIGMLSLWGNDAGVNIGARCSKLHVNPQIPLAVIAKTAGTSTFSSYTSFTGTGGFPTAPVLTYKPAWAGARIYWQGAWEDSKTKAFSLTHASRLTLPKMPAAGGSTPGVADYTYEYFRGTTKYGPYGPYKSSYYRPIVRWNKK